MASGRWAVLQLPFSLEAVENLFPMFIPSPVYNEYSYRIFHCKTRLQRHILSVRAKESRLCAVRDMCGETDAFRGRLSVLKELKCHFFPRLLIFPINSGVAALLHVPFRKIPCGIVSLGKFEFRFLGHFSLDDLPWEGFHGRRLS